MFAHSGFSIAMSNASHEVQEAGRRFTTSNSDEDFASAVERFILAGPGAGQTQPRHLTDLGKYKDTDNGILSRSPI